MANILIIDDQKWVIDLCREGLNLERHKVSATDNIESVRENIFSFKPDLVFLNLYLKYGFFVWDVLKDIKMQDPDLPVLIITANDRYLFDSRLSQADGYVIKSHFVCEELKQKIDTLMNKKLVATAR
ncbi:MAG TPA: response regulator [Desulfobacterales bacterium]|nr:response regulator [Desulfobacterales bacterium]